MIGVLVQVDQPAGLPCMPGIERKAILSGLG